VGIGAGNLLPPFFGEHGIPFVRGEPTLHVLAEIGVLVLLSTSGWRSTCEHSSGWARPPRWSP
jgi:hypothetical protein